MDKVKIVFDIEPTSPTCPFHVEVWLDQSKLLSVDHVTDVVHFEHELDDDDGEHELRLVLQGKLPEHTKIDEQGNIISDATLQISNVTIDKLDVDKLFQSHSVYTHDFNGTQPEIVDTFHGIAGCNGTISFKFNTPVYLWLLENM
jgi:hypothetical protein